MVNQKKNAYLLQIEPDEKLYFRRRQRGDRFEPLGSPGSKKVKDWMIDRKWDQYVKETVPLIVNNNNQIIWIPGFPPAKERSINSSSGKVIRLTYHQSSSLC
jgi:tRNA(Ile)-lysidine synthase